MRVNDRRLWFLLSPLLVAGIAALVYAPVLVAWATRSETKEEQGTYTVVSCSWPLKHIDILYQPLVKFHARCYGLRFLGMSKRLRYPDPDVDIMVFTQSTP